MRFKTLNNTGKYGVYSVAKSDIAESEIKNKGHKYIKVNSDSLILMPEESVLYFSKEAAEKAAELNDYDVIEIFPDGTVNRYYDDSSSENVFFITEKCNSNCIMCPSPDSSRMNGESSAVDNLIILADYIPDDARHFTITGGEPFMIGKDIFRFLGFLKNKFERTEFQILTNGRVFALDSYRRLLKENLPSQSIIGIPIHASYADLHDEITRADGSFTQTITGIKGLLELGINIEVRVVVNKLNFKDLEKISILISKEIPGVRHVSIMGMEMTGNAWLNRDKVWVSYKEASFNIKKAVDILIDNGIDVWIYNFPLCTLSPELWTLCKKSISLYKVKYKDECNRCTMKDACGGIFAGTFGIEENEIKAIV